MGEEFNETYITLGGFEGMENYRYLYFTLLLTLCILSICSNAIIVYIIWEHQNLHEPMYIFIAALSINSLLVSINIYPKLLIDFLSEKQTVSYSVCLLQYFLYYCLGIVDLLLLAAMAFDRYVSICKPLVYPNIMTNRTVVVVLVFAWFMPASQLSVSTVLSAKQKVCHFVIKGFFCTNSIFKLHCVNSKVISVFGLVSCMFILGICPVFFVLFTYARILFIVYKSSNDVRQKAAETCLPHLLVLLCFTALGTYDVVFARFDDNFPKIVHLIMTLQVVLYNPLFNPIIYGFKMKEIFKHLKKLFGCT
ncbi:olfactory receptor 11H2-like [Gouania willdenowi]|uniref:Olfactory receptor n=1 Tax=Gouania willdenowi TaxID=441366 RepID=A0A8C5GIC0_GOUWI|nr:olfactory receptor 11H2-like [Gouania willdenowi]